MTSSQLLKNLRGIFFSKSFLRFCIVGGGGTLTNLLVFYVCVNVFFLPLTISSIIAFCVAVTQNYFYNHLWSFKGVVSSTLSFSIYTRYVLVYIGSLIINLIVLHLLVELGVMPILAQAIGIGFGMILNYVGSFFLVFIKKNE